LHHDIKKVHSLQSKKFNKSSVHLSAARELKKAKALSFLSISKKGPYHHSWEAGRAYRKLTSTETSAQMVVS